ncbi:Centrosomal protein of 78 kDa [Holothuria leucospilota]|uniref:Centrosomal protein of 78 kDa n=1 Tax=Holothuria leucospilota TaxID=206669 RepID=A0A9Q1C054_HOLLE|nr:Centrosomal protein of 78 kDa [Holothuria leucospilota]
MIESVQARHLRSRDFLTIYTQLCALQDTCPLTSVKAHLSEGTLDLNVDRIRLPDWAPILNSLRINKNLQKVALKSYYQSGFKSEGKVKLGHKHRPSQKPPPILSKDVTHKLCISLRECLQGTESLERLSLQGIPLRKYGMQNIAKGLSKTRTLQHLSLEYCRLSNTAVGLLCQGIYSSPCLKSLNLTGCGLTKTGAEAIAKLIKHQSTSRHSEAWKDSLRYRRPNLDQMPGLRRITLNNNPLINDAGALSLADALKDDLWLKALDMQHCGISNIGGAAILEALKGNATIVVLDIRRNPLVDHSLLKSVIEQVLINGHGREEEYPWLVASSPDAVQKAPSNAKKKRNVKKKENRPSPSQRSSQGKSTVVVHKESRPITKPGPGFVPWRSAARAEERQRSATNAATSSQTKKPEKLQTPPKTASSITIHKSPSARGKTSLTKMGSSVLVEESISSQSEDETTTKDESISTASEVMKKRVEERKYKELLVQLEEVKRRVDLESRARAMADAQILELTLENSRLKRHIQILERNGPLAALSKTREQLRDAGKVSGLDEDLLETIEQSFQKFHTFLDLLRDAGLGQLCSLVGLSPTELQNPAVASILKSHQPTMTMSNGIGSGAGETNQFSSAQNGRLQSSYRTGQFAQATVPSGYIVSNGGARPQVSVFKPSIINESENHFGLGASGSVNGSGLVQATDTPMTRGTYTSVPYQAPTSLQAAHSTDDGGESSGVATGLVTAYQISSGEHDRAKNNSNSPGSVSHNDLPRNGGREFSDKIVLENRMDGENSGRINPGSEPVERREYDDHGDTPGYGDHQRKRNNGSARHHTGAGDFVFKDSHLITPQDLMPSKKPDESGSFRILPAEDVSLTMVSQADVSIPMVSQAEDVSLPVVSQAEGELVQESLNSNLEFSKDGSDHSHVRTSTPEITASSRHSHHSGEDSFGGNGELPSQVELGSDDSL